MFSMYTILLYIRFFALCALLARYARQFNVTQIRIPEIGLVARRAVRNSNSYIIADILYLRRIGTVTFR